MEENLTWNFKDLFESENDFENAINKLNIILDSLKLFKGSLDSGAENLYNCYKTLEEALVLHERIYAYSMFKYHQDMSNQDNIKLFKRVEKITSEFSQAESFIAPELSKLSDEKLNEYLYSDKLSEYKKTISDIIKGKKHILSEEIEKTLAKYSEIFGASENTFDVFTNTELDYEDVIDKDNNHLKMNAALYSNYLMSKDEDIRRQAFNSMYNAYKKRINTITELYLTKVKEKTITAKLRNYESSLDRATDNDDSNAKVYDVLLKEVNKNLYLNHDYISLKSKLLNRDKLHMYDVYVNTLEVDKKEVSYDEAKQTVLDALNILGKDYQDMLKTAFNNRWLDVYAKDNKMSGAYSMGVYGVHPFVLLNFTNTSRDISTIAHELGHSMHSYYSNKSQNVINSSYTIMVAEVASTVNEILLANYLIDKEEDKTRKAALINEQLDMIRATLIRQSMFAEFEKEVHQNIEKGESLTSDDLNSIYFELVKKYFGNDCICDDDIKYEWARIPHFYSCFYVYKYSTGITAAIYIASKILSGEEGFVDKYINMLSQGGSKDSLSLLRMVDVDLEKEETYEVAFKYFSDKLNELKNLL